MIEVGDFVSVPAYGIRVARVENIGMTSVLGQKCAELNLEVILAYDGKYDAGEVIKYTEPKFYLFATYYHYPIKLSTEELIREFEYWLNHTAKALSMYSGLRGKEKGRLTRELKKTKKYLQLLTDKDPIEVRRIIEAEMDKVFKEIVGKSVEELAKERMEKELSEGYVDVSLIVKMHPILSKKRVVEILTEMGAKEYNGFYSRFEPIPLDRVFSVYNSVRGRRKWIHSYELWKALKDAYGLGSTILTLRIMEKEGLIVRHERDPNVIMVVKPEREKCKTIQMCLA